MAQPLKDIGERIDLLQLTLAMFAPGEPAPVSAELLQLAEEILEHALAAAAASVAPAAEPGARLGELLARCRRLDPAYGELEPACDTLLARHGQIISAADDAECGAWLVDEARAAGVIYAFVAGRLAH